MISSLNASTQRFLNDLTRITERQDRAQRQMSSGLRLQHASDDPDQVSLLLETRAGLSRATQISNNIGRIKTEVDAAESALSSAVSLTERVRVLGTQGANDTQTAQSRQAIAGEVGDLLEQLVRVANSNVEGRYVFSGNADQMTPYAIDWSQPYPVSAYQGSAATRRALTTSGDTFAISHSGETIFDNPDPAANVFQNVNALHSALLAGDPAAIETAVGSVGSALGHLNTELAYYGTVQSQTAEVADDSAKMETQLGVRVGQIEDADLTQSIVDLQQAQLQQSAALGARAKVPLHSLFDYLG